MKRLTQMFFLVCLFLTLGFAATPACPIVQFHFTATGQTTSFNNVQSGCNYWYVAYNSTGFSAVTLTFQSAPGTVTPGTWVTFSGTVDTGSNPNTNTTAGYTTAHGYVGFYRMALTATGTGVVNGVLFGTPTTSGGSSGGGGTCGALAGDLSGTCAAATVIKVNGNTPGNSACAAGSAVSDIDTSGRGDCVPVVVAPSGAAGGDLSSTYPNPTVAKVNGNTPGNGVCPAGQAVTSIDSSGRGTCAVLAVGPTGAAGGDLASTYPNPTVSKVNGNTPGNSACAAGSAVSTIDSSARGTCVPVVVAPAGAAGGDLSSTYPNPTVAKVNGNTPGNSACAAGSAVSTIDSSARGTCVAIAAGNKTTFGTNASYKSSPPASPAAGDQFISSDGPYRYVYSGSAWQARVLDYPVTEPILANLTQVNVGRTTFDITRGGIRWFTPTSLGTVSDQLLLVAKPMAGAYYLDIGFTSLYTNGGNYNGGFGPVIAAGTTVSSAFEHFQWGGANTALEGVIRAYANVTSTPTIVQSGGGSPTIYTPIFWLRLVDDGTTNRSYYFCSDPMDASSCYLFYSVARTTTFTPADIGVGFEPFNINGYIWLVHFNVCSGAVSSACW